jgi:hypothetical protein
MFLSCFTLVQSEGISILYEKISNGRVVARGSTWQNCCIIACMRSLNPFFIESVITVTISLPLPRAPIRTFDRWVQLQATAIFAQVCRKPA